MKVTAAKANHPTRRPVRPHRSILAEIMEIARVEAGLYLVIHEPRSFLGVILSITTTAVSRAHEGGDAHGFKVAPFRSSGKHHLCIGPRLALCGNHWWQPLLHQPSIRFVSPTMILVFELPELSGRQGAHSSDRSYSDTTG